MLIWGCTARLRGGRGRDFMPTFEQLQQQQQQWRQICLALGSDIKHNDNNNINDNNNDSIIIIYANL